MSTINDRIYKARKSLKISQTAFAESLGTTRGVIVNLENGETSPKPQFISLLCSVYRVNRTWLETGEGEMFREQSMDEQIAEFAGKILSGDNPFKKQVFFALSQMDDAAWEAFQIFYKSMKDAEKKENGTN